jgi:hypothetical protein
MTTSDLKRNGSVSGYCATVGGVGAVKHPTLNGSIGGSYYTAVWS